MSKLHPDLRLGAVLVGAALLLSLGRPEYFLPWLLDRLDVSASALGWALFSAGIGTLAATIGTAIWMDRHGPHPMMALGTTVVAMATLLTLAVFNLPSLVVISLVRGIGGAAVASVILYAVAVKGAARYPGLLIGAIAAVSIAPLRLGSLSGLSGAAAGLLLATALVGLAAFVLHRFLPRVYSPTPSPRVDAEPGSFLDLLQAPAFWRTFGPIALVFLLSWAFRSASRMYMPLAVADEVGPSSIGLWSIVGTWATAVGALAIGVASDWLSARRLLLGAAAAGVLGAVLMLFVGGWSLAATATVGMGIVRGVLFVLPWVLLAKLVTVRHFASVGVIAFIGATVLGFWLPASIGWVIDWQGAGAWMRAIQVPAAIGLLLAAWWVPRQPLEHRRSETSKPPGAAGPSAES